MMLCLVKIIVIMIIMRITQNILITFIDRKRESYVKILMIISADVKADVQDDVEDDDDDG